MSAAVSDVEFAGTRFPSNFASFVCSHVFQHQKTKLVIRDEDGALQFLCGEIHDFDDPDQLKVVGLGHVVHREEFLNFPPSLPLGQLAELQTDQTWKISEIGSL